MNGMTNSGLSAYSRVGLETGVSGADPHKLIAMLFEGAIVAISLGKGHMQRREIAPKGMAISRAIAIIDEGLKVSLDEKVGGELAANLKSLYEYMSHRLLIGNLKNDPAALDEVLALLTELKGAWDEIGKHAPAPAATPVIPQDEPRRVASVSYGKA